MIFNRYVTNILSFLLGSTFTLFFLNIDHGNDSSLQERHESVGQKLEVFAIFLILSAPGNFETRRAVRETWGKSLNRDQVRLLFSIGENELNKTIRTELKREVKKYHDLFFVPMSDRYSSLARKLLLSLQHVGKRYSFNLLFKGDDDTYVNAPELLEAMKLHVGPRRLYWGYFSPTASVKSRGKWKETEWFLCDKYLPYAYGGGYILSQSIVNFIADNADKLSLYNNEDVSLGTWVAGVNVTRIHDIRFNTGFFTRGCRNNFLVIHKVNTKEMKVLHSRLNSTGEICEAEHDAVKTYLYNWSVVPSQCCGTYV